MNCPRNGFESRNSRLASFSFKTEQLRRILHLRNLFATVSVCLNRHSIQSTSFSGVYKLLCTTESLKPFSLVQKDLLCFVKLTKIFKAALYSLSVLLGLFITAVCFPFKWKGRVSPYYPVTWVFFLSHGHLKLANVVCKVSFQLVNKKCCGIINHFLIFSAQPLYVVICFLLVSRRWEFFSFCGRA